MPGPSGSGNAELFTAIQVSDDRKTSEVVEML